jgi:c-di-GMP-binding flagellar brake protein YcgR
MSFFKFMTKNMFHQERAEQVLEKLLKDEFIYQLRQDSTLELISAAGEQRVSTAITMDRKRNSLIIAEKCPQGRLILERNDPVMIVTQANSDHEVFSFNSKVSNIILDDGDILYEVKIPNRLKKGQRRKDFRMNINSPSEVIINHSVYSGQVSNLSTKGVLFTVNGYWPEAASNGDNKAIVSCHINMNFMSFNCNIDVRYINFEPFPGRRTFIGGQLNNLQPLHQHQLDNFLTAGQRILQREKAERRIA